MAVERPIVGYHRDEEGDWVADLGCGHGQHVRHRPPFQPRPWVLDADSGAHNQLWRNEGGGRFRNVTAESGAGRKKG